jgi:protein tyrosine phosphatase (PTP) superfamily phosphohydrolase (DUF442 family)
MNDVAEKREAVYPPSSSLEITIYCRSGARALAVTGPRAAESACE